MDKITMTTPLVEMDGDEMTRVLWKIIKDELLLPYIDLKTEYYDLGLEHRNETDDQVTVDSDTYRLEEPFLVIATQNPIETAGTYQLPEAQLDRFLMKICMGYPEKDGEIEILNRFLKASPLTSVESVCSKEEVLKMQQEAKEVYVHPSLMGYIVDIAAATRKHSSVAIGVSPRGTLTMVNAARAFAYIEGREYIVPEDIRILAEPVFAHRLVLRHGLTYQDNRNALMQTIMESVEVPTEDWGK